MKGRAEKITLGGKAFNLQPPTLGQLRHILDALEDMSGKQGSGLIDGGVAVILAGLRRAHPDLTTDALLDMESTVAELNDAVAAIIKRAGLKPAGEMGPQPEQASPIFTAP